MRDIEDAFRDESGRLLLSRTAVSEIGERLRADCQEFAARDLSEYDIAYLFVDGIAERTRPPHTILANDAARLDQFLAAFTGRDVRFAFEAILANARWPLNTSLLEGINNKIKVIKRIAYGFRDDECFFLKIRDAFPGVG